MASMLRRSSMDPIFPYSDIRRVQDEVLSSCTDVEVTTSKLQQYSSHLIYRVFVFGIFFFSREIQTKRNRTIRLPGVICFHIMKANGGLVAAPPPAHPSVQRTKPPRKKTRIGSLVALDNAVSTGANPP